LGRRAASAAGGAGGVDKNRQLFVQHILVPPDKQALLTDLANLINDGADFGELAEQHSTCPSAKQGGLIGWVTPGKTAAEFEAAAFSAPLGEMVTCVSCFGAHLLRVNEQRPLGVISQMAPAALKVLLDAGNVETAKHQLVDVREANELAAASLPGFELFALSEFNRWAPTISTRLDPSKSTLVLCHHGVRSMQAAEFLVSQGFTTVSNITGGIDLYSLEADPSVPRY
jgi:rhodanese-related sulfurtransferase